MQLGGGEIKAAVKKYVADNEEHTVRVNRIDNNMYIDIDNDDGETVSGSPSSKQLNLGANPELHIGGIPQDSKYYGYVSLLTNLYSL